MSWSSRARPRLCLKLSVTLSLLRLMPRKYALSPAMNGGPQARVSSPLPGCSTLMTRAPMSPSSIVQYGPDRTRVRSRTVRPASGPSATAEWLHNLIAPFRVRISTPARTTTVIPVNRSVIFLAALLAALPVAAQTPQPPTEPTVAVTGEGIVQAVPDRAWVTITAESRAGNPRDAQRRNVEAMTPVLAKLKAAGIAGDAIRTVGYDL